MRPVDSIPTPETSGLGIARIATRKRRNFCSKGGLGHSSTPASRSSGPTSTRRNQQCAERGVPPGPIGLLLNSSGERCFGRDVQMHKVVVGGGLLERTLKGCL